MKRVLVGLSGGVDSAVTARILMNEGYQVHGAYLALAPGASSDLARRVAEELGIPFTVIEKKKEFQQKIVRPFLKTYREGKTPNPCVECNGRAKIPFLLAEADRLGIPFVATGHYAGIVPLSSGRMGLSCGKDPEKDQSYFLWRLSQGQLRRLIFPLADAKKRETLVSGEGLVPKEQKESMEICFVPGNDTKRFLLENGGNTPEGDFVDASGKILGRHKGISCYTVGQRKGLGVAMGERYFVTEILPERNQIVLAPEEDLFTDQIFVHGVRWVSFCRRTLPKEGILFRGRHRGGKIPCRLNFENGGVWVQLDRPCRRFAPGQSACFYFGDLLAFGGYIGLEVKKTPLGDMCKL